MHASALMLPHLGCSLDGSVYMKVDSARREQGSEKGVAAVEGGGRHRQAEGPPLSQTV